MDDIVDIDMMRVLEEELEPQQLKPVYIVARHEGRGESYLELAVIQRFIKEGNGLHDDSAE
ncbi:MAG: hypothetical protein WA364_25995 [Candidatus Nitrosopolaris sp.]